MMHDDLLAQATHLATLETGRPKLANLRRAVSSLYYSLFHYLIFHSTCEIMGTQPAESRLRHVLARAYEHGRMKEACDSFSQPRIKKDRFRDLDPHGYPVGSEIQDIASVFVELQDLRHRADYNLNRRWSRSEVLTLIKSVEDALSKFESLKLKDPHRSFFLGNLIAWSKH
ncbi:hypothetical protein [Lacunimicrobium album]